MTDRPAYCKCAFTDPDGTFVPGEACTVHPDVTPQRAPFTSNLKIWQPTSDGGMEEVKPGQWYDIGRYVELEDYERLRAAHAESERQLREWQDRCARAESPDETKAPPSRAAYDARGDYIRELQEALSQLWSDVWVGGGYRAPTKEKVLAALKVQPASSVQETTARQVFNHERDCGLTDDVGTCECPQKAKGDSI